jgi:hypothetical protein
MNPSGKPATGQLDSIGILTNYHRASKMTADQTQDYIDLVIVKADQLGEHYVARQVAWGAAELERLQLRQVRENGPFVIQPGEGAA